MKWDPGFSRTVKMPPPHFCDGGIINSASAAYLILDQSEIVRIDLNWICLGGRTLLTAAILPLRETIPAIDRAVFTGLERNFAFLFAVCTDC